MGGVVGIRIVGAQRRRRNIGSFNLRKQINCGDGGDTKENNQTNDEPTKLTNQLTCICTRVGGWRIREPGTVSDTPLTESIASGGVMGLQKEETLETGAVYCSPWEEPGVMAGEG